VGHGIRQGAGSRVQGNKAQGIEFRAQSSGNRAQGIEFRA